MFFGNQKSSYTASVSPHELSTCLNAECGGHSVAVVILGSIIIALITSIKLRYVVSLFVFLIKLLSREVDKLIN